MPNTDPLPLHDTSFHAQILRESKEDVFKKYKTVSMIGSGSMGAISKVKLRQVGGSAFATTQKGLFGIFHKKKKTGELAEKTDEDYQLYALKSIQLDRINSVFLQELENEIHILRSLDHPNIVKAHEVYKYRQQIYIVLELCDGGDLYTRAPYSERSCWKIVHDLLSAVAYLHNHKIVHRDLKFENVMFENEGPEAEYVWMSYR